MASCEYLNGCPFFFGKMENMPTMADMFRNNYCLGDNTHCARFVVREALGKGNVPSDLFPNDFERARRLASGVA